MKINTPVVSTRRYVRPQLPPSIVNPSGSLDKADQLVPGTTGLADSLVLWVPRIMHRLAPVRTHMYVVAVDHPEIGPRLMADRFRTEIVYFMTPAGSRSAPAELGPNEYWISLDDARGWLEEFVVEVVSPLDAASKAEVELSETHEAFLEWIVQNGIQHVRLES